MNSATAELEEPAVNAPETEPKSPAPRTFSFSFPARALREALPALRAVAGGRTTLPILSTVHIERDHDVTRLSVTDLDLRLTYIITSPFPPPTGDLAKKLQANRAAREDGAVCVMLSDLQAVAKAADVASDISITNKQLAYRLNGAKAISTAEFYDASEFPPARSDFPQAVPLPNAVRDAIFAVLPSASEDESRLVLNTVCATDRHVVAADGRSLTAVAGHTGFATTLLLPREAVQRMKHLAKFPWTFAVARDSAGEPAAFQVQAGLWIVQSRTVEGNYPDWQQAHIIPPPSRKDVVVQLGAYARAWIVDALKRLPSTPRDKLDSIGLEVRPGLVRLSVGEQGMEIKAATSVKSASPARTNAVRKYWKRVADLGCTELRFADEMSPNVCRTGSTTFVFMPVRRS